MPTAWVRDLLVHGDDLVAATQGRAIWVLGDLALLRQLAAGGAPPQAHLFTPASTYRVRINNNHDTPLAPETPVGENPPEGAVIDYWLAELAQGSGDDRDPRFVGHAGPALFKRRQARRPSGRPLFRR